LEEPGSTKKTINSQNKKKKMTGGWAHHGNYQKKEKLHIGYTAGDGHHPRTLPDQTEILLPQSRNTYNQA
jgi:hypothetical protein